MNQMDNATFSLTWIVAGIPFILIGLLVITARAVLFIRSRRKRLQIQKGR